MKELLQYLKKYFYRYRGRLALGVVFVLGANIFRTWQPKVIRQALDAVAADVGLFQKGDSKIEADLTHDVLIFGLTVIGLALLMGLFMFWMRQTIIVVSRLIEYDMRKEIFAHYERLDLAFYKKNKTGDLMSRISEDVSKVRMFLGPTILYGVDTLFLFTLTVWSMVKVSPSLTLWSLAPLPLLSVSIFWVSSIINKKSEKIQAQLGKLTSTAQEVFSGIRVVKSYAQEEAMNRHFAAEAEVFRQKNLALIQVDSVFFPLMALLIGTSVIITVYVGGLKVAAGEITPGNIAEFIIYVNMLTWPITSIGWIASLTQQAAASQKRINEILKTEPKIASPTTDETPSPTEVSAGKPLEGEIEFKNVSFKYEDTGIEALRNVSFSIKKGQKVAIIGRTGSGKSTIADLLVRTSDATEGQILIDQKDVRQHDLANLRRRIGYVPQDVFLFSDTIFNNIGFGKPDLTEAEAIRFSKYAAVHDDILGLPKGYETMVGERGVTLSGGQKQRVSIARAFAKSPDLLVLDDCLSAVDTTTEQQIMSYLNEALADRTAILITHRIYGLADFDQILVLENGEIVAAGTHEKLLKMGGYYAEQWEKQMAEAV